MCSDQSQLNNPNEKWLVEFFCVVPLGLFFDRLPRELLSWFPFIIIDFPGDSCWSSAAHSVETLEQTEDSVERILRDSRRQAFSSSIFFILSSYVAHLSLYWLSSCSNVEACLAGNLSWDLIDSTAIQSLRISFLQLQLSGSETILPSSVSEELNRCFESANSVFIPCNSSFND